MPQDIEDTAVGGAQLQQAAADAAVEDKKPIVAKEDHPSPSSAHGHGKETASLRSDSIHDLPTAEELATLRRVSAHIPLKLFTIAFVELCERFSYYGCVIVYTNYIQQALPPGSTTGAGGGGDDAKSGALDMGQRASTGITTFNTFWQYCMPLFGAYVADKYWGRYKTICWALGADLIGHVVLILSAIPPVIVHQPNSLAALIIGIIIIGFGTGGFKPNINPLIIEQLNISHLKVETLKTGEKVIIDPAVTINRVYNWFYMFINIGALVGQISMVYAEKYVGFYLSFLLPTCMIAICPLVMLWGRKRYTRRPPSGSVLGKAVKTFVLANKGRWSLNPLSTYKRLHDGTFWENVKPSKIDPASRPKWMTFDDHWVDELRRGFHACSVFTWYPIYWLTYNQLNNNLISQAATMQLNGLPNDVLNNLDPLALIIFIPICDFLLYPALRKAKIRFTPIKKITTGFYLGSAAMIWAAVLQAYIYRHSECGDNASGKGCANVDINVWAQTGAYVLIALSEIFASITSLEYAYSKAPKNMRSLVQAVALFTQAISSAIGEAFVSLSSDPLLVWNYGVMAVLAFIAGTIFFFQFRDLDKEEDQLNELPEGKLTGESDEERVQKTG